MWRCSRHTQRRQLRSRHRLWQPHIPSPSEHDLCCSATQCVWLQAVCGCTASCVTRANVGEQHAAGFMLLKTCMHVLHGGQCEGQAMPLSVGAALGPALLGRADRRQSCK
jgi:hypothetical protein